MITSKHLITALEKTDWLDRIVILSAFMFFILVVLFILKQRFIDRGLRIALWWTRFVPLPDFHSTKPDMLSVAEEGSAVSLSVVMTTATSTLSSLVASSDSTASPLVTSSGTIALDTTPSPAHVSPTLEPEPVHVEL